MDFYLALPKWLMYSLLCIFWWGIFGFTAKLGASDISSHNMQILFTIGVIPVVILAYVKNKGKVETDKLGITYGVLNGIFAGLGGIAYFAAMEHGKASIVGPVTSLFPLITIFLAMFLLNEKMNVVQIVGVVFALISIVILSITGA